MNTKLTLSIEKDVVVRAKKLATKRGRSLSDIVENYLRLITAGDLFQEEFKFSPKVKRFKGIFKTKEPVNYKEIIGVEIVEKYGI